MPDTCPVIKKADPSAPGGYVEVNETDFDPKTMTVYDEKKIKLAADAKAKADADAKTGK